MKVDLKAKHVLITGANRGIGLGLAEGFLEAGATVTIVALEEDVAEVAEQLSARYERQVLGISCDIADLSQIDQMQAQVKHAVLEITMPISCHKNLCNGLFPLSRLHFR